MRKTLKFWNGRGDYNKLRGNLNVCVASQKAAIELLKRAGLRGMSIAELRNYYSDCWGKAMDAVSPEEGVWIVREVHGGHSTDIPERLI